MAELAGPAASSIKDNKINILQSIRWIRGQNGRAIGKKFLAFVGIT
jgi:hypothetical protein